MSEKKEENIFVLDGAMKQTSSGLEHLNPPPDIKGKSDHGISPSLTFYFENEVDLQKVADFFKEGQSRVPSGKKVMKLLALLEKEEGGLEWWKRRLI